MTAFPNAASCMMKMSLKTQTIAISTQNENGVTVNQQWPDWSKLQVLISTFSFNHAAAIPFANWEKATTTALNGYQNATQLLQLKENCNS